MRRRVVRAACAAAIATGLLLSAGGGTALGGGASTHPTWRAAPSPFRLTFLSGSGTTVAEAAASGRPGGRLGYVLDDGSTHGLRGLIDTARVAGGSRYRVATDEPGRTALVTVRRVDSGVSVSLRLVPATGVAATFEAFAARGNEHFLGGGERPGPLDLRGQALAIKTSYACRNTMPAAFFLSSAGYGATILSTAIAALAFPGADPAGACAGGPEPICPLAAEAGAVQLCLKAPALAYRLFFGDPLHVVSAYSRLVGRPALPPASEFELIKWRDIVSGPSGLYDDVDHLRAAGIPIGWVLLDNPWERGLCYGDLQFDPARFPDPAGMIRALHAEGVRLMLWVSPLVRLQWCPPPPQYPPSALIDAGGSAATLDLTDAATTQHVRGRPAGA